MKHLPLFLPQHELYKVLLKTTINIHASLEVDGVYNCYFYSTSFTHLVKMLRARRILEVLTYLSFFDWTFATGEYRKRVIFFFF